MGSLVVWALGLGSFKARAGNGRALGRGLLKGLFNAYQECYMHLGMSRKVLATVTKTFSLEPA